jgi:hypothetical protein
MEAVLEHYSSGNMLYAWQRSVFERSSKLEWRKLHMYAGSSAQNPKGPQLHNRIHAPAAAATEASKLHM